MLAQLHKRLLPQILNGSLLVLSLSPLQCELVGHSGEFTGKFSLRLGEFPLQQRRSNTDGFDLRVRACGPEQYKPGVHSVCTVVFVQQ